VVYYLEHMISYASGGKETLKGKRVVISGSGNVAQFAALKVIELGGIVLSLSDSKGAIVATTEQGIDAKHIGIIADIKLQHKALADVAETSDFSSKIKYIAGARPWLHAEKVDIAIPGATQNEVSAEEAEGLIKAGCKFIAEGSNMGSTQEAIEVFEKSRKSSKSDCIWYAPGKAANAGGVAVSGLEMAQNSARIKWTSEEVDNKLKGIMKDCFENGLETAKKYAAPAEGEFPSLVAGSNIAGFVKVAEAMKDHGDWW